VLDTSAGRARVDGFQPVADVLERDETNQDAVVSVGAGGTAIVFDSRFHLVPQIEVMMAEEAAKIATYDPLSVTETGFTAFVRQLSDGAKTGGDIRFRARGA
jgi:hypothetical protein